MADNDNEVNIEEIRLEEDFIYSKFIAKRSLCDFPVFPVEGTKVLSLSLHVRS
jgi:hypothetical protein